MQKKEELPVSVTSRCGTAPRTRALLERYTLSKRYTSSVFHKNQEEHSYKPKINQKSEKLAKDRFTICLRNKSLSSYSDLLIALRNKPVKKVCLDNSVVT